MYATIGHQFPRKTLNTIEKNLIYAGLETDPALWLGKTIIQSIIIGIASFFGLGYFGVPSLLIQIGGSIAIGVMSIFLINLLLILKGDSRAKRIEDVFPDALQLISANIRAGMTPEKAIWTSARKEFGDLQIEIQRVASETFAGDPLSKAFLNMNSRINSAILNRTIQLLVEGMTSGGELAVLLDETRAEIEQMAILQKEAKANVSMYVMFITFASLLGAPLLFGVSTFFVEILTALTSKLSSGSIGKQAATSGVSLLGATGGLAISPAFLMKFSITAISIIAGFAALLVGLIKGGDAKYGLKYVPLYIGAGVGLFLLVKLMFSSAFGDVFL